MPDRLFSCPTFGPTIDAEPKIVTPLGTLIFDAEFAGVLVGDLKPSAVHRLESDGYIFRWTLDGVTAELLLCRPRLALPEGMAVDDCWAGMWRLRTTTSGERPAFSCRWEPGYQWIEGGPNSGEGLDAQTWDGDYIRVTVGTIDAGWLTRHAQSGLLPSRWAGVLDMNLGGITPDADTGKIDPIVYLKDGFRIVLPALETGEQCQVQFVIAWSTLSKNEITGEIADYDISTWFAVDLSPQEILRGAGCP